MGACMELVDRPFSKNGAKASGFESRCAYHINEFLRTLTAKNNI